jgi:hypothetical protein
MVAELSGRFFLWLASEEAKFLKGRFVWVNWDVDELKARAEEIQGSKDLELALTGPVLPSGNWKRSLCLEATSHE